MAVLRLVYGMPNYCSLDRKVIEMVAVLRFVDWPWVDNILHKKKSV